MKNETKLKELMGWLDKNNIEYNTITRVMVNQQKHYMREHDRKKTKLKR